MPANTHQSNTIVTQLTPPGRGALATISLQGPAAHRYALACLAEPVPATNQAKRPWLRTFGKPDQGGEELVVAFLDAQRVRLHCHGGAAACEAVLQSLEAQGAVRVSWEKWTSETNQCSLAATAEQALSAALTERAALILLDQWQGALKNEIEAISNLLGQASETAAALTKLDELIARASIGLHLTRPWRVVIAGKPNAGKSSLLNALLGFQRSITSEVPGTTRDVVTERTAFNGWPVELRDTAGLRESSDELEVAGVELARNEIATADLLLLVIPANEPCTDRLLNKNTLLVRTKCDLLPARGAAEFTGQLVSAVTAEGVPELIQAIVDHIVPHIPAAGTAVPFTTQQVEKLQSCRRHIPHELQHAQQSLSRMLSE